MRKLTVYITLIMWFSSCGPETIDTPKPVISSGDVLISNEGNFGWGEATLSVYNPSTKEVQNGVYKSLNNAALGNVFQSINYIHNQFYFVINNSSKIVIADDSIRALESIDNLTSPRFIYEVESDKAFVTDLYNNGIHIIDLNTNEKTGEIYLPGWTEQGLVLGDKFWVCNVESNYVYVIDIPSETLEDSIQINYAPQDILMAKDSSIWVLSRGGNSDKSALTQLDKNGTVLSLEEFENGIATRLNYNSDYLYFIKGDVYHREANSSSTSNVIVQANGKSFYGLGVNNLSDIYVSDAGDFTQASSIYRYDASGNLEDEFKCDVISSFFHFR